MALEVEVGDEGLELLRAFSPSFLADNGRRRSTMRSPRCLGRPMFESAQWSHHTSVSQRYTDQTWLRPQRCIPSPTMSCPLWAASPLWMTMECSLMWERMFFVGHWANCVEAGLGWVEYPSDA